jgi:hypothetical protein
MLAINHFGAAAMIIPLHHNQTELRLRLARTGLDRRRLADKSKVRLVIRQVSGARPYGCPENSLEALKQEKQAEQPAFVYPCLTVDEEDDLMFRFDDFLWHQVPGRYVGEVEDGDGRVLAELVFELARNSKEASWVKLFAKVILQIKHHYRELDNNVRVG